MLEMFIYEMSQLVEQLEQTIIKAESGYSMDEINEIFRIMHTIKGASAMMMYENIANTAHAIEDLFYFLREENPQDVDYSTLTDFVLEGMDFVKVELDKVEAGEANDGDGQHIIDKIKSYLRQLKGDTSKPASPAISATSIPSSGQASASFDTRYSCTVYFQHGAEMENIRAYTMLHNMKDTISSVIHIPEDIIDESSIERIRANGFHFEFNSNISIEDLRKMISETLFVDSVDIDYLSPAPQAAPQITAQMASPVAESTGEAKYTAHIMFENGAEMENVRAYALIHNLEEHATIISHTPEDVISETAIDQIRNNGFTVHFTSSAGYDNIYQIINGTIYLSSLSLTSDEPENSAPPKAEPAQTQPAPIEAKIEARIEPQQEVDQKVQVAAKPEAYHSEALTTAGVSAEGISSDPRPEPQKKSAGPQVISVSVSKLDQLLNLMGELVIAESMVTQNQDLEDLELESFYKEALQLRKIISDVQDNVMSMRMVPLSATFFKMHRIVRDMCKQLNKEVELVVVGEETEVDKNIIEHIADPLMHIIRNSIDHGIEMPDTRGLRNKPRKGNVTLEAKNAGGDVHIIISDDGNGLNRDKILAKAKMNGLLRKPESEYSDKEIYQFIFLPGFSTNDKVTSFSGRGVGMDVVSTNLEIVGGSVIVDSEPGEGSRFTLKIPLTLAIIDGMIVRLGDAKYTIPIISIQQSFKASKESIFTDPSGNEMIMVRGEVYNLIRLYEFFGVEPASTKVEDGIIIMLENGDQTICVLVDELIGQQPIVVKTLPKFFKKIRGISTSTLLGNGEISLIIDPVGFFDK